jgi:hypothetical protein
MPQPRPAAVEQEPVSTERARVIDNPSSLRRPAYPVRTQRGLIEAVIEAFAQLEADRAAAEAGLDPSEASDLSDSELAPSAPRRR